MRCIVAAHAPPTQPSAQVRLVVVEDGALSLDSHVSPDDGEETVVVVQSHGELPLKLAERVVRRIAAIERSARRIGQTIVLLAARLDEQSMAARYLLARALLAHVGAAGPADLMLAVSGDAELALRHGLLALVETLVTEPGSRTVSIRIRFGTGRVRSVAPICESGVWPRARSEWEEDTYEAVRRRG